MPDRRTYTPQELNDLLNASRQPTLSHHPAVCLLVAMALVLENIYAIDAPPDEPDFDWLNEMATLCQEQVLRGTAAVLEHGVPVEQETVN